MKGSRVYNRTPIEIRFWQKVIKRDGCWGWSANKHTFGYGLIFDERGKPPRGAHRLSWEIHRGSIPEGLHVLHNCDNAECTNPDHLFLGTHADNMADKVAKGRIPHGSGNTAARLTEDQVLEIRSLFPISDESMMQFGKRYGVSNNCICRIVNRITWTHI